MVTVCPSSHQKRTCAKRLRGSLLFGCRSASRVDYGALPKESHEQVQQPRQPGSPCSTHVVDGRVFDWDGLGRECRLSYFS